jgi:hypothetical protein
VKVNATTSCKAAGAASGRERERDQLPSLNRDLIGSAPASAGRTNLSDEEVDDICAGLRQNAAKVRYLRDVLNVPVQRKPNGRPLVLRADWERRLQRPANAKARSGPNWSVPA